MSILLNESCVNWAINLFRLWKIIQQSHCVHTRNLFGISNKYCLLIRFIQSSSSWQQSITLTIFARCGWSAHDTANDISIEIWNSYDLWAIEMFLSLSLPLTISPSFSMRCQTIWIDGLSRSSNKKCMHFDIIKSETKFNYMVFGLNLSLMLKQAQRCLSTFHNLLTLI